MAAYDLYIDTGTGERVASATDGSITALPQFIQGDTPNFRIFLLKSAGKLASYTLTPVAGITIQAAIGTRIGNTTSYYTQQFTWTPSTDLANPYWSASLPMNTAAITTLLGSSGSASAFFEVKMIEGGVPTTVLSKAITIVAAVIKDGGVTVPAGLTPLSAEAASAMYLGRTITGAFTLVSADGLKSVSIYVDTDGTFHADPIT